MLLARFLCIFAFLISVNMHVAHAASVPVTVESDLNGILPFDERNTCDPEFWDVIKDRAWEEGQREITQNQNLIARPDSVLSMTCFDSFLDHLSEHSDDNFPGEPNQSDGGASGFMWGLLLDAEELLYAGGDGHLLTRGYLMYSALELLVLDQLMEDVTGSITRAADLPALLPCDHKQYYIDDNFPSILIGGRAVSEGAPLPWLALSSSLDDDVDNNNYNGCARMNNVWNRTKCYDFATESLLDVTPPGANPPPPSGTLSRHDGFYPLQTYRDESVSNRDYRTRDVKCDSPLPDGRPDFPSAIELACDLRVHGLPGSITLTTLAALFTGNSPPTWDSAHSGANPTSDITPLSSNGGVDAYFHYLGMRGIGTTCSSLTPIKTGYFVTLQGGIEYEDAVCSAPGCYFNPPTTGPTGTCN